VRLDPLKCTFWGILYLGPQGVLLPEIFTRARDWPRLPSAHPNWDGGPPKNFNREKLKIGPKIQCVRLNNFRASGSILTGLFHSTPREAGVINLVHFLQCPTPKICDGQKIAQNLSGFLTTFDFDPEYLRNGSSYQKSEKLLKIYNHSHVEWKKLVYFGPQTTKFIPLINLHHNGFFSGDYISALMGCCALKFLHVLEIHQGYLAHTPTGTGVTPPPKKKLIVKIKNLA